MDFFVELTHVDNSGKRALVSCINHGCFGDFSGKFVYSRNFDEYDEDNWFASKIIYAIPLKLGDALIRPTLAEMEEIVNALNMPEMSLVRLADLPIDDDVLEERVEDTAPIEDIVCVQIECADLDRGDVMRNMFMIRNTVSHSFPMARYRSFREAGMNVRQVLAAMSFGEWPRGLGNRIEGRAGSSNVFGSRCFGYGHTSLKDFIRFLANPQDARGRRSGTFRENAGRGYTTGDDGYQVATSFTIHHDTGTLSTPRQSKLFATVNGKTLYPIPKLVALLGMENVNFQTRAQ